MTRAGLSRLGLVAAAAAMCLLPVSLGSSGAAEETARGVAEPPAASPPPLGCGLTSLRCLLHVLAVPTLSGSWQRLVDRYADMEELSLADLIRAGAQMGVQLSGWEMSLEELAERNTPAIVHLKQGHFITFVDTVGGLVRCMDADGRVRLVTREQFEAEYSGRCLLPEPKGQGAIAAASLAFDELHHHVGATRPGEAARYAFTCRNTGSAPVRLAVSRASEGCAAMVEGSGTVGPNEVRRVVVEGSVPEGAFQAGFWVELLTNDPGRRVWYLSLTARGAQHTRAVPDRLGGSVPVGQGWRWTVELRTPVGVQVRGTGCDSPHLSVSVRTADIATYESHGLQVVPIAVTVSKEAPAGEIAGTVTITTDDPQTPVVQVPVTVRVRRTVTVTPPDLFFGRLARGQTRRRELTLAAGSGRGFAIREVTCDLPAVALAKPRIRPQGGWVIPVRLRPTCSDGALRGVLRITTDLPTDEVVEVPVFALVTDEPEEHSSQTRRRQQ